MAVHIPPDMFERGRGGGGGGPRPDKLRMKDKLYAYSSEAENEMSAAVVKRMVSEKEAHRALYANAFDEVEPTSKPESSVNDYSFTIIELGDALDDRLLTVPCKGVALEHRDERYGAESGTLPKYGAAGLHLVVLGGAFYDMLASRDFLDFDRLPPEVREETRKLREHTNPVRVFYRETLEVSRSRSDKLLKGNGKGTAKGVWERFCEWWIAKNGHPSDGGTRNPLTQRKVENELGRLIGLEDKEDGLPRARDNLHTRSVTAGGAAVAVQSAGWQGVRWKQLP